MNFQQLRIIREAARRKYNLTDVANALFTSQSGVSKHIKDLEDELGIEIFVRRGKRLLGLTEPGKELVHIVERMLLDAKNIKQLADQFSSSDQGQLIIATTHTQARYVLPAVVAEFKREFPKVHLALHQGSPQEIANMLANGEADLGIATEALEAQPDLVTFPYYQWQHALVVPDGHPLLSQDPVTALTLEPLTLEQIAEYPIITYHQGFTGRAGIDRAFAEAGVLPNVVMSALDSDVIKTYVDLGLGIGIIAATAFNPRKDQGLHLLPCPDLFPTNTTRIAVKRGHYLRGYAYHLLALCSPQLTEDVVRAAVAPQRDEV